MSCLGGAALYKSASYMNTMAAAVSYRISLTNARLLALFKIVMFFYDLFDVFQRILDECFVTRICCIAVHL
ncbi:hypothetical protein XELAEV_18005421mg [Xenopus laevis]|uniref:Uncharacterized protein n=1 Tax=Xenopus laevis TaxID=8355 RepID=A0A974DX80_XENLA|nr:hypothetical protein XELAEV_18005421mg [Xenopus laevis]